jgi:uncharacterized membrane protein YfcA
MSATPLGQPPARPAARRLRALRLGAIATAAGAFSRLFGAGGGTIIVPLLVLWLGYEQKEATGTSLAATLANAVSERGLELSFAAVQLMFAWQLAKKAGLR